MIETYLIIYFSIVGISLLASALWLEDYSIKGIDNFWDWIIYSLFWIVQPIKSIIKYIKNIIK